MTKSHSQCPECQTVFTVTEKQLAQRKGLVRCGRCDAVFQADEHLVTGHSKKQSSETAAASKKNPNKKNKNIQAKKNKSQPGKTKKSAANKTVQENEFYQAPLPTVSELIHGRRLGPQTRPVFWVLGVFVMVTLLAAQWMYFYRDQLARDKQWTPYVQMFCQTLRCTITPRHDVGLVQLTDTRVTPHPKFDKALRVRATLINRAKYTQPFPLMEVTLTNTEGKILARKRFSAREYLKNTKQLDAGLAPNVARKAQLEITSPDTTADGYEIRLLPPV
ncbi:MAG: zinc-ribbon and DUF3426 domain-containing protein [Acidiferrobacterales bacterium]